MIQSYISPRRLDIDVEGLLSALRQFLTNENPLKMMKNVFLFHVKFFFCSFSLHPVLS